MRITKPHEEGGEALHACPSAGDILKALQLQNIWNAA